MEQGFLSYWWIIIVVGLAFLFLVFSLERRGSREKKRIPENYINGLRAMVAGNDDDAFVKLKQAVAEDTDNIDAYLKLGDLFRKRGQIERAVRIHQELILRKNIDSNMAALVRQSLIRDYLASEKFEPALELLEKLTRDASMRSWAQEKTIEVFEKTRQWEKVFALARSLWKGKDQQLKLAIYRYMLGNDLYGEGEFHKARHAYKDALHYQEDFAAPYVMIAESYLAENRKEDAVEFYQKLARHAPSSVNEITYKMEQTLFELGQYSEVEAIYNSVLQRNPDDANILKALAGIAEKKGDIQTAIDALSQTVLGQNPDFVAAARLVELYLRSNRKDRAIDLLRTIQAWSPPKPPQFTCPHCRATSIKQELVCPNCRRVGPYNKA